MARAIAGRGFGCAAGGEKTAKERRATVRNAINLWLLKKQGEREKEPAAEQFTGEEKNKSAAAPCKKKRANLRSS